MESYFDGCTWGDLVYVLESVLFAGKEVFVVKGGEIDGEKWSCFLF